MESNPNYFMNLALLEARKAQKIGEVPVGAVLVHKGQILAQTHNLKESRQDPTAHCEVLAIQMASQALGTWRLNECELFVTLEPCPMCSGALAAARMKSLYFGAYDKKSGGAVSQLAILNHPSTHHKMNIQGGLLEPECSQLLKDFFKNRRQK